VADSKLGAYFQGLTEIPGTTIEYVAESIPTSGPFGLPTGTDVIQGLMAMGADARGLLQGMGQVAKDEPVATARGMIPVIAETESLMDADNLISQALAAENAGDAQKASTLRQLAVLSASGGIPFVPKFGKVARKAMMTPNNIDEKLLKLEQKIKNKPADAPARQDLGEGRQIDLQESPKDVKQRTDTLDAAKIQQISELPRLERAKALNFETDRVLYHGTDKPFGTPLVDPDYKPSSDTFNFPDTSGIDRDPNLQYDAGPYLTPDLETANTFADSVWPYVNEAPQGNVIPVYVKGPGLKIDDRSGPFGSRMRMEAAEKLDINIDELNVPEQIDAILRAAKGKGYGYLEMDNVADVGRVAPQIIPLGPDKVRSVNAQFDPRRELEGNLSYAQGGIVTL
jgi:hypothetical protein